MPIYEYRCLHCGKRVSVFVRTFSAAADSSPRCPACYSEELRRLVSRVRVMTSEESRIENLADPDSLADVDENDPRTMARWMRRMGQEMGEDLGDDFQQVVDRLEAGQSPEEIEADLPDVGGGDLEGIGDADF